MTASTLTTHPITDKLRRHKDGTVLLSIEEDRICKLNGVGALTWMILEDKQRSVSVDEVVCALEDVFQTINAEGELHYEVPQAQLHSDTTRFLSKLAAMGLLSVDRELYSIKSDVSATTSSGVKRARSMSLDLRWMQYEQSKTHSFVRRILRRARRPPSGPTLS